MTLYCCGQRGATRAVGLAPIDSMGLEATSRLPCGSIDILDDQLPRGAQ